MIWAILILAALLALAVVIGWQLWKSRSGLVHQVAQLGEELGKRDHIIKAMEAAYAEANKRKDSMASGTDAERFDASVGVLHDISGEGKPPTG
jgi:predicted negative regulator of RcsB-dependent stress response